MQVGGCGTGKKRAIVAGNSIGGYTALLTASKYPDLVLGVASLNGAGRFAPTAEEAAAAQALASFRRMDRARKPVSAYHTRKLACAIRGIILASVLIDRTWPQMSIRMA